MQKAKSLSLVIGQTNGNIAKVLLKNDKTFCCCSTPETATALLRTSFVGICGPLRSDFVLKIRPVQLGVTLVAVVVGAFLFVSVGSALCHAEHRLSSFLDRVSENRGSRRRRQPLPET